MLTILRGTKKEKYLGVIGSYLIEVLYHDPILFEVLSKTKRRINSLSEPRLHGSNKFMILRAFTNDALVVIRNRKNDNPKNSKCKLVFISNKSAIPTSELIAEARLLAKLRWRHIMF